jgi:uncharacterized protein (TIGR03083 family)
MNEDGIWAEIDAQRERTADLLDTLTPEEWRHPSLCAGWTVRDVAAHLTLQQLTMGWVAAEVLRHPTVLGSMNRMIRLFAIRRAANPTEELIRGIRAMIGSRRRNTGVSSLETLTDILVHGQDIAIPLGRTLEMPPAAAAAAAARTWSFGGKGMARVFENLDFRGLRVVATDAEFSVGEGPEVRGPISAILLLLTGRKVVLPALAGEGAEILRRRSA